MTEAARKVVCFVGVGVACAALSYLVFAGLIRSGAHYMAANACAWAAGAVLGFLLNRRLTFEVRGSEGVTAQAALVAAGSLGQLAISSTGSWLMIRQWALPTDLAFAVNLLATASFMFLFMNNVAFRARGAMKGRRWRTRSAVATRSELPMKSEHLTPNMRLGLRP